MSSHTRPLYSLIISVHPSDDLDASVNSSTSRLGEITVDWVDFTQEKNIDRPPSPPLPPDMRSSGRPKPKPGRHVPGSTHGQAESHGDGARSSVSAGANGSSPSDLSLQPLLAHLPGGTPAPYTASGISEIGRGIVHLFKHAPPPTLIASLDAHPVGESSLAAQSRQKTQARQDGKSGFNADSEDVRWDGDRAEGEDGSLIAVLAVPAWMRPGDFLEWIGGWGGCLEGVRMIREATTPNRSIVLLKFRDPLQAADFLVIFTGRPFSTLDSRETCHPIRIHHLVLHHDSSPSTPTTAIPAFPPSTYSSRLKTLPKLLKGVPQESIYELPSCPVCLERLDSTVTGLVTLPCAHTFDCDCLRKWGDSRCPVCRVSHLLLSSNQSASGPGLAGPRDRGEVTRLSACATCGASSNNWICIVCGVVGCGRYEPGKAHARRHWEESGHVLAMELETQRVWDYKGDNYVHRLIQTRTDGKLVELPSASSLVTSSMSRPLPLSNNTTPHRPSYASASPSPRAPGSDPASSAIAMRAREGPNGHGLGHSHTHSTDAGPSTDDVEKMSTIEAITLEYSYLLSSQLEAMRQHYESQSLAQTSRLDELQAIQTRVEAAERAKAEADAARIKAERKADKASELTRSLQASLSAERAMSEGLSVRVGKLKEQVDSVEQARKQKEEEVKGLEETVRDLMFTLDAGMKIQEAGGEGGAGGDLGVAVKAEKGKKKRR